MLELEKDYKISGMAQEKMMEEINKNPELEKQLNEVKDAMMKLEQKNEANVGVE